MTLAELCEPLFHYLCRLNRSARSGGSCDFNTVRSEVAQIFERMKNGAAQSQELTEQFEAIKDVLTFFVDSMIVEGRLSISEQWHKERLAYAFNELAGDEKFFDLLEETLENKSRAASERLVIFYTCIGLGFEGFYAGKPDYLKRKMREMGARIKDYINIDDKSRTCPEAYDHLDTRNLVEPPGTKLLGIIIAIVGLLVVLFITNVYMYRQASHDLTKALKIIVAHDPAAAEQAKPESQPDEDE